MQIETVNPFLQAEMTQSLLGSHVMYGQGTGRSFRLKIAILNQFHYLGWSWACFMIQVTKEQKNDHA